MVGGGIANIVAGAIVLALVLASSSPAPAEARSADPAPNQFPGHAPILIEGNAGFTAENGVRGGTGTPTDPWVIENWGVSGGAESGIAIANTTESFVIRNVSIVSENTYWLGIRFRGVHHGAIKHVWVNNSYTGIDLSDSADVAVSNVSVAYAAPSFSVLRSSDIVVADSAASPGSIYVEGSTNVTIRGSSAGPALATVVFIDSSSGLSISGNVISGGPTGIRLQDVSNSTLEGNTIQGGGDTAITVYRGRNVRVARNVMEPHALGLHLLSSENVSMEGNVLPPSGLFVDGLTRAHYDSHTAADDNTVAGRPILYRARCADVVLDGGTPHQVLVAGCERVRVANLTLPASLRGLFLAHVDNAVVENVTVEGAGAGAHLVGVTNSTLTGNTLRGNNEALEILDSSRLLLYRNNLIKNLQLPFVRRSSFVTWYATYPMGGNYWSGHAGTDRCSGPLQDDCTVSDGIGDVSYWIPSGAGEDRYPLLLPYGIPPAYPFVGIQVDPSPTVSNQLTLFRAEPRDDPDGFIVSYSWTFGDGTNTSSSSPETTHAYASPGTYSVSLRVVDNSGLPVELSVSLEVRAPYVPPMPPVASFNASLTFAFVGDVITFDGSSSSAPSGTLTSYAWTFGDGTGASGAIVTHAYPQAGTYIVSLEVVDDVLRRVSASSVVEVTVEPELVLYEDDTGFRIPIPRGWGTQRDVQYVPDVPGEVIDIVVSGPVHGGFVTNILIDTGVDPTIQETYDYLNASISVTIDDLRQVSPDAYLDGNPSLFRVSGHLAVAFTIGYEFTPIRHAAVFVVREADDRYWIVLLSTDTAAFPAMERVFAKMIAGLDVGEPLERGASTLPLVLGLIAALLAVVVVLAVIFARSRGRSRVDLSAPSGPPRCPRCGQAGTRGDWFCTRCGYPMRYPPPGPGGPALPPGVPPSRP